MGACKVGIFHETVMSGASVLKDAQGRVLLYDDTLSDIQYKTSYHPNGARSTYSNSDGFHYWFNSEGKMVKSRLPSGIEYFYTSDNKVWKIINIDKSEEVFDSEERIIYKGRSKSKSKKKKLSFEGEYWIYDALGNISKHINTAGRHSDRAKLLADIAICQAYVQNVLKEMSRSGYIPKP